MALHQLPSHWTEMRECVREGGWCDGAGTTVQLHWTRASWGFWRNSAVSSKNGASFYILRLTLWCPRWHAAVAMACSWRETWAHSGTLCSRVQDKLTINNNNFMPQHCDKCGQTSICVLVLANCLLLANISLSLSQQHGATEAGNIWSASSWVRPSAERSECARNKSFPAGV